MGKHEAKKRSKKSYGRKVVFKNIFTLNSFNKLNGFFFDFILIKIEFKNSMVLFVLKLVSWILIYKIDKNSTYWLKDYFRFLKKKTL